jgi:hypothetical protein
MTSGTIPTLTLGLADLASEHTEKLTREQVPSVPQDATWFDSETSTGPNRVADAVIGGVPHRWRYERGELRAYYEYRPNYNPKADGHPWRKAWISAAETGNSGSGRL